MGFLHDQICGSKTDSHFRQMFPHNKPMSFHGHFKVILWSFLFPSQCQILIGRWPGSSRCSCRSPAPVAPSSFNQTSRRKRCHWPLPTRGAPWGCPVSLVFPPPGMQYRITFVCHTFCVASIFSPKRERNGCCN